VILDQTLEYYQKRAPEYDQMVYFRDDPDRKAELAAMYATSQNAMSGRRVLDVACGTGFFTRIVAEKAASILGIDINAGTIAEAGRKQFRCPIHFVRADFFRLPSVPSCFDGLLATFAVSHIRRQELERLREETARVIRQGSRAFLCDNNLDCEVERELVWDDDRVNSYKKRRLKNGEEFVILKNYYSRDELEVTFGRWGAIERLTFGTYYWSVVLTVKG